MADAPRSATQRLSRQRARRGTVRDAREMACVPDTAELAGVRALVRDTVAEHQVGEVDFAEFVVTELATNAIVHGQSAFTVRVGFAGSSLRIEVTDASDAPPLLGRHQPAIHGLEMVDKLVHDWGYELHEGGGKTVWAEVPLRRTL
ncbi:MAG TPA: ATP-binding protein [Acidimicrobiales bacterium]